MNIPGKRVKRTRLVHTDEFIIAVEVEAVIPDADPGAGPGAGPCYEPETVEHLREVEERAQRGDLDWLRQHGKVCRALDAA